MFKNFQLNRVKLNDNYFLNRRNLAKSYVAEFPIDRLMHTFRKNAGFETNAEPLGGWESEGCGLRGHFVGHYLSAISKFSFSDSDKVLGNKANEIIDTLYLCAKQNGYLSAFPEDILDILEFEENRGVWAPYYTLHKIIQGLLDCYNYLNNRKALQLATNLAHYIYDRFQKLSSWKIDGILRCTKVNPVNEFGGIGDALYGLFEATSDQVVLKLAKIFDRDYFIGNLLKANDILENLHANTHLPLVIAAMHRYNITKEEDYKKAAINFYRYLIGRTFANGNNSSKASAFIKGEVSEKSEHWSSYNHLSDALTSGESESCCAHNTEKIVQQLFEWFGNVEYLDHIENLKYNAVLNSASNKTGLSIYHQPMGTGCKKKFSSLYDTFWCCTASGVEAMSEINKNIYFKSKDSVLVNMFISSTLCCDNPNTTIIQKTKYPDNDVATFEINTKIQIKFKLMFKKNAVNSILLNGKNAITTEENGYIILDNDYNNGDVVEVEINSILHMVPLKGSKEKFAIMYGNVLLAQLGEKEYIRGLTNENINGRLLKLSNEQLKFICKSDDEELEFIPLFMIEDEKYTVYIDVKNDVSQINEFTYAKDGSSAYNT